MAEENEMSLIALPRLEHIADEEVIYLFIYECVMALDLPFDHFI